MARVHDDGSGGTSAGDRRGRSAGTRHGRSRTAGRRAADGRQALPQTEVDRIAAREKDQGRRAGQRAALEALGFDPDKVKLEDVKKTLDGVAAAELERLSEVERRELAATQREQAAAEREAAAARTVHESRLTTVLVAAGVPGTRSRRCAYAALDGPRGRR